MELRVRTQVSYKSRQSKYLEYLEKVQRLQADSIQEPGIFKMGFY